MEPYGKLTEALFAALTVMLDCFAFRFQIVAQRIPNMRRLSRAECELIQPAFTDPANPEPASNGKF